MADKDLLNKKLISAIKELDHDSIRDALLQGADVNGLDDNLETPLFYAVRADESKAKVFKGSSDSYGFFQGREQMVRTLLKAGADPNITNRYGSTPLHELLGANFDCHVADLLLEADADINAETKNGQTPLHEAVYFAIKDGKIEGLSYLLKSGADHQTANSTGVKPLTMALGLSEYLDDKNSAEVITMLREAKPVGEIIKERTKRLKEEREKRKKLVVDKLIAKRQAVLRKRRAPKRFKR